MIHHQQRTTMTSQKSTQNLDRLPKLCGADIELGNFILGLDQQGSSGHQAAKALLAEIQGIPHTNVHANSSTKWRSPKTSYMATHDWYGSNVDYYCSEGKTYWASDNGNDEYHSQDWGRKFLACNGGCVYIDLGHLELCVPECLSAFDHLAAWHAMLRIAREALHQANACLPQGQKIQLLANNSDGQGNSYGSHLDFLVTRRCFDNLFHRKLQQMLFLAAYQISSIVFTGAGKVDSENNKPHVNFQISQRADFYEVLTGVQTTYNRPIINSRDESLCGDLGEPRHDAAGDARMARLHVIFFDNTLCHVSSLLKVGVTQIILAMIEQGYILPSLLLDNPLRALLRWSHDPSLRQKARLIDRKDYTAVELQMAMADRAGRFLAAGRAEGIVPHANQIFTLWTETLEQLKKRDFQALASKLDWVLKHNILEQAIHNHDLNWDSPQVKYLDQMYSNLDLSEGLYWAMEQAGVVQKLVTNSRIERFVHQPPSDTRAYTRAMVLRSAASGSISSVDWDGIRLKYPNQDNGYWPSYLYFDLPMDNPLGFTKEQFERAREQSATLPDTLRRLGMRQTTYNEQPLSGPSPAQTSIVLASNGLYTYKVADETVQIHNRNTVGLPEPTEELLQGGIYYGDLPEKT